MAITSKFRYDINALRAIAISAVLIFHFEGSLLPGGFAGVDVFFVISGFLMTKIVCTGLDNSTFSYARFFLARVNRIVPPLIFLCLSLVIFGWFFLIPGDYEELSKNVIASMIFLSNLLYWSESSYFDVLSSENLLLHTWSLSAEWQFYLLFPVFLTIIFKRFSLSIFIKILIVLTLLAFFLSVALSYRSPSAAYYLLPSRIWEMLVGAIAYFTPSIKRLNFRRFFLLFGLASVVLSFFIIDKSYAWPGIFGLFPVMGAYFIIISNSRNVVIFNNPLVSYLGKWSYSIYLWHWPIIVLFSDYLNLFTYVLCSLLFGYISYFFIECRFNFKNRGFLFYLSFLVCLVLSILVNYSSGAAVDYRSISNSERAIYLEEYRRDNYLEKVIHGYRLECDFFDGVNYKLKGDTISNTCVPQDNGGIFLWGDSHAQAISFGLRKIVEGGDINQVTTSACKPYLKPVKPVTSEIDIACKRSNAYAVNKIIETQPRILILAQQNGHDTSDFFEISEFLKLNSVKTKLVVLGPVPQWNLPLPVIISRRHFDSNVTVFKDELFKHELFIADKKAISKYKGSDIDYISILDHLCNEGACIGKVDRNNTPLVWDYGHLTLEGSELLANSILLDSVLN